MTPIAAENCKPADCPTCGISAQFQTLFSKMSEGFALGRAVGPGDLRLMEANAAFKRQLGLDQDVEGRSVAEVIPDSHRLWLEACSQAAGCGAEARFEYHHAGSGRYYEVVCYSPAAGHFALLSRDVTERRQAEEALRQRVEELQKLLDVLPAMVWIGEDPECRLIRGNAAANQFMGVDAGTNVSQSSAGCGLTLRQFAPEGREYRPEELPMQRAVATGQPVRDAEIEMHLPDGRCAWIVGNAAPLFHADGKSVRGSVAAFVDITDRKRAEGALARSEGLLRAVIDHAPLLLFMKDPEGRFLLTNRPFADLFVPPGASLVGKTDYDIASRTVADMVRENDQQVLGSGAATVFEEIVPINDELRTFLTTKVPVRDAEGRAYALLGIATDITERVRMEARLLQTEESFRVMADNVPDIIFTSGPDGACRYVNRRFYEYTGMPEDAPLDRGWAAIVHPDDLDASIRAFAASNRLQKDFQCELRLLARDGTYRWHLCRSHPVFDGSNRIVKWFGTSTDIDDRKRAEEELTRYRENLEQLVRSRTQELQSLYGRQESIREEEKARIAREIHDELGATLALVNLDASRLVDTLPTIPRLQALGAQVLDGLRFALGAARRIQTELHPPILDDLGLAAAVQWQVEDFAKRAKVKAAVRIAADGPLPKTLEIALFRILQEALTNVARHAQASRIAVELGRQGENLRLVVADNGIGLGAHKDQIAAGRFGIRGMRERARQIGGNITIGGGSRGTTVMVEVPLF